MIGIVAIGLAALLLLIGPVRAHTLARLDRLSAGGLGFTISNRRRFADSLALAGVGTDLGEHAAHFTAEPGVTVNLHGIHFWDNTPPVLVGTIDWSRVSDIRLTEIPGATLFARYAIDLAVTVENTAVTVSLVSPNSTRGMRSSRRDGHWIAQMLEHFRAAALA